MVQELLSNRTIIAGAVGWFTAQVIKTIIYAVLNKTIDLTRMVGDGMVNAWPLDCLRIRGRISHLCPGRIFCLHRHARRLRRPPGDRQAGQADQRHVGTHGFHDGRSDDARAEAQGICGSYQAPGGNGLSLRNRLHPYRLQLYLLSIRPQDILLRSFHGFHSSVSPGLFPPFKSLCPGGSVSFPSFGLFSFLPLSLYISYFSLKRKIP